MMQNTSSSRPIRQDLPQAVQAPSNQQIPSQQIPLQQISSQTTSSPKAKDNKVRLSYDVLDKAQMIAAAWGLKNARAAVEAVFRRYADDYLGAIAQGNHPFPFPDATPWSITHQNPKPKSTAAHSGCEALDVLDELLGF